MKRLSDNAIEIVNELHTEDSHDSEYVPIIDALNSLAAYEDTGLEPEEIQEAVDLFKGWKDADIPKELKSWVERCTWHVRKCKELRRELDEYKKAEAEGRLVVLPCKLGDTVYCITECSCENIDEVYTKCEFYGYGTDDMICTRPSGTKCPYQYRVSEYRATEMNIFIFVRQWGKRAFATREEAEKALEGK